VAYVALRFKALLFFSGEFPVAVTSGRKGIWGGYKLLLTLRTRVPRHEEGDRKGVDSKDDGICTTVAHVSNGCPFQAGTPPHFTANAARLHV
jgi:hypothetical protein